MDSFENRTPEGAQNFKAPDKSKKGGRDIFSTLRKSKAARIAGLAGVLGGGALMKPEQAQAADLGKVTGIVYAGTDAGRAVGDYKNKKLEIEAQQKADMARIKEQEKRDKLDAQTQRERAALEHAERTGADEFSTGTEKTPTGSKTTYNKARQGTTPQEKMQDRQLTAEERMARIKYLLERESFLNDELSKAIQDRDDVKVRLIADDLAKIKVEEKRLAEEKAKMDAERLKRLGAVQK